ncbi:thioesterase domain-containing protein [Catenulispora sp. GP43]|uniref:thioesterase domain-containing protein n=1 Tax=Catenulispora sp. GP43 TaxID=3156263 RepID=UPI003510EBF1
MEQAVHTSNPDIDRVTPPSALTCRVVEDLVRELWSSQLGYPITDPYIDFYDAGGDSVSLIEIVAAAQDRGLPLRSSAAFGLLTPARVAEHLVLPRDPSECARLAARLLASASAAEDVLSEGPTVQRTTAGYASASPSRDLLFFVHSDRYMEAEYDAVADWTPGGSIHDLRLRAGSATVAELADRLLPELRARRPRGPYRLVGFDLGAPVAYELARRLRELRAEVALLVLIAPPEAHGISQIESPDVQLGLVAGRFALTGDESPAEVHARMRAAGWLDDTVLPEDLPRLQRLRSTIAPAAFGYTYPPYDGPGLLVTGSREPHAAERSWTCAGQPLEAHHLDYGLECPLPVLRDSRLAETMRKVLDT